MGHLPSDFRAMTPRDWGLRVEAWNAANNPNAVSAPTQDQFDDLVSKYG